MKAQKELAKICKDLVTISRKLQKLTSSITKGKDRAPKAGIQKPVTHGKRKKSGTKTVLDIVRNSTKGINVQTLIKKTGFEDKTIRNIIFKALKGGKIERVGWGVYKSCK